MKSGKAISVKTPVDRDKPKPTGLRYGLILMRFTSGEWPNRPGKRLVTSSAPNTASRFLFNASRPSSDAQGPESIYEEARKAIRIEQQSGPKIIKANRPL